MKLSYIIVFFGIAFAFWYYCNTTPPDKPDEGARLLAEAAEREKAQAADREARAAIVARLQAEARAKHVAEEQGRNTTLAQDDAAMARERARSWYQKTTPTR